MNLISDEYIKLVITDIAAMLKLKEWTYTKQKFEDIAQNYFGVLIPIHLNGKSEGNDKVNNISLVLKLAPTDERYRVSGALTIFFAREIFAYTKILSKYREIQIGFPVSSQFVMPNCYYVRNSYCKELIAIQNMCVENYKPFVKSMFLDLHHISVALISLARFHALSYIFEKQDRHLYDIAKEFCVPLSERTNKRYMEILVDRLKKALVIFENTDYVPLLEDLKHNCVSLIESAAISVKSVCLCHGDIWKENILFKYEDNLPVSACLIDYQTTRICSPAFDVLYLIITSTTSNIRKESFSNLLDLYYETFKQTLEYANLSSEEIYSREMLDYDLRVIGPPSLIVANTAIWLASGLQEEGHVKSKIVLTSESAKLKANARYKDIMIGILNDLSDYNYLNTAFSGFCAT